MMIFGDKQIHRGVLNDLALIQCEKMIIFSDRQTDVAYVKQVIIFRDKHEQT